MKNITSICFLLIFTLNACVSTYQLNSLNVDDNYSYKPENRIIIAKWRLQSVNIEGKGIVHISQNDVITLEINDNNRFSGYSGCNSFHGELFLDNDNIFFDQIISTSRICPEKMSTEKLVLTSLRHVNNYIVKGNKLFLLFDKKNIMILVK